MKKQLIIGVWHPSVILTYLGAVFSLMGICVLSKNVTLSVVFLLDKFESHILCDLVHHHKSNVVIGAFVLDSGVAQSYYEIHILVLSCCILPLI